jgi:hypothetical protein
MNNRNLGIEFNRFGGTIPTAYWGCCAACIIQNFHCDPDAKASIQIVEGDGGSPMTNDAGELIFAGPTNADIFRQRLRIGTFSSRDMPNHAFFAILTKNQLNTTHGKRWLALLKENGFEFIRTVSNSVYGGAGLSDTPGDNAPNYVFGMFRNIGTGFITDPFTPPKEWTDLPSVMPEAWETVGLTPEITEKQRAAHKKAWEALGPAKFMTEAELVAAEVPVIMAGLRSSFPPQAKAAREEAKGLIAKATATLKATGTPTSAAVPSPPATA